MADSRQSRQIAVIDGLIGINALVGLPFIFGVVWAPTSITNTTLLFSACGALICFIVSSICALVIKSTLGYCSEVVSRSCRLYASMATSCIFSMLGFAILLYASSDLIKMKMEATLYSIYIVIVSLIFMLVFIPLIVYIGLVVIFYGFVKDED
jgi:hypothetical protein